MNKIWIGILLAALLVVAPRAALARPTTQYRGEVSSPRPNAVLRGQVVVNGTANHPDFWKYEVRVAPGTNPGAPDDQWFRLTVREQAVNGGQLAVWDTAIVPDGVYTLRLRVVRRDGNWQDFDVLPLNVSNSAPPTSTPPPPATETPVPEATPTEFLLETPTPDVLPTLPSPGGDEPTPLPTAVSALGVELSPTPVSVDQPVAVVQTPVRVEGEEGEQASGAEPVATRTTSESSDGDALGELVDSFSLGSITSPFLYGAGIAAGLFLIVGLLYLVKVLVRVFQ